MAVQMLYQAELGGTSAEQILASFDPGDYRREPDDEEAAAGGGEEALRYARRLVSGTLEHREEIDALIRRHAENWRLERMPAIDRNILRLAIYEMVHEGEVPKVVVLDEAIELAKKFGSESSGRFVNGLLDGVLKLSLSSPERPA